MPQLALPGQPRPAVCLSLLVATCALLFCQRAEAGRLAIVTRGSGAGADKAAALTGYYVADTFDTDERYEPVELSLALGNVERNRALSHFQLAETLVQKGREAYDGLDLDTAEASLKSALTRYERYCAWVDDFKKMADALLLLGAVRILKGNERGGTAAFEQAIGMVPGIEPDPKVFNPAMRVQFSQTVAAQRSAATGAVSITSAPSYSWVFVDGRFAGVTPLPIDGVSAGRHVVRVEHEGYRPWGTTIDVVAHGEAQASASLRQAGHFEQFDSLAERATQSFDAEGDNALERTTALRSLAELLDADAVFLSRVHLDGERVQVASILFEAHGKTAEKKGEHTFAYDPQLSTYEREVGVYMQEAFGVSSASVRAGKKTKKESADDEHAEDAEPSSRGRERHKKNCGLVTCPTAKKIVVGTLIGAGGVAVAAGGVEWLMAKKGNVAWRKLDQAAANQPKARVAAYNNAVAGDVLVGLGVASAIGGVLVAALWHPVTSFATDDSATEPDEPSERRKGGRRKGLHGALSHFALVPSPAGAHLLGTWELP